MTDQIEMAELHGQPVLKLQTPDGAVALVSLFGAQVLSWTPAGGEDRLYLSPEAVFDGKTLYQIKFYLLLHWLKP